METDRLETKERTTETNSLDTREAKTGTDRVKTKRKTDEIYLWMCRFELARRPLENSSILCSIWAGGFSSSSFTGFVATA